MKNWSIFLNELSKSLYGKSRGNRLLEEGGGKEAVDVFLKEAKKSNMILKSSGFSTGAKSNELVSVYSQRGEKGVNQDCSIVWQEYGCQEDMVFCGLFDGHGLWGHYVAKMVRDSLPRLLLCNWQEAIACSSPKDEDICQLDIWMQSYIRTCASVDAQLEHQRVMDSFNSGTTSLTIIKQGDHIIIANVGDSRAVLATASDDGSLLPVQLTIDFKPNLPQEAERIRQCKGHIFCLSDEPGVHRVWLPNKKTPGLAMSRAFGDYCIKKFGLISLPEVTQRMVTDRDQFIVLATDGVWDVISNQEAVDIVSSSKDKSKSAKLLVKSAVRAWKRKRRGIAVDDCSAICMFFPSSTADNFLCFSEERGREKCSVEIA